MKVELTEENFCKLIDTIEEYWRAVEELEDKYGIDIWRSFSSKIIDTIQDFLTKIIYGNEKQDMNDIDYYMWELDFGRKWEPGYCTYGDGTDIPLKNSHELWKVIEKEKNQKI